MIVNGSAKQFSKVQPGAIILLGVQQEGAIGLRAKWGEDSPVVLLTGAHRGTVLYLDHRESVLELAGAEVRILADVDNTRWGPSASGDLILSDAVTAIVGENRGQVVHFDVQTGEYLSGAPGRPYVTMKDWQIVQKVDGRLVFLGVDRATIGA